MDRVGRGEKSHRNGKEVRNYTNNAQQNSSARDRTEASSPPPRSDDDDLGLRIGLLRRYSMGWRIGLTVAKFQPQYPGCDLHPGMGGCCTMSVGHLKSQRAGFRDQIKHELLSGWRLRPSLEKVLCRRLDSLAGNPFRLSIDLEHISQARGGASYNGRAAAE